MAQMNLPIYAMLVRTPPLQRRRKHLEPLDGAWHMAGIVFHTLTWHTDMNM